MFTPEIAGLLNTSYIGLSKVVQEIPEDISNVVRSNYRYLPYVALAVGAAGVFVAMLRGAFSSSNSSSKK